MLRPQLIPIQKLLLDAANFRLPELNRQLTQPELIDVLVANYAAEEVAENISRVGYMATECLAVVPTSSGKYVVVEGNRRLTACLCLLSPDKAPPNHRTKFRRLRSAMGDPADLKRLPAVILPSRSAADVYLVSRHTRPTTRKWNPLMQARFYHSKLEEHGTVEATADSLKVAPGLVREQIKLYSVVMELRGLGLPADLESLLSQEVDFLSTLMRLFNNEDSRARMQAAFDEAGQVSFDGRKTEVRERMTRLLHALKDGVATSRTLNTADQRRDFLTDLGYPRSPKDADDQPGDSNDKSSNPDSTQPESSTSDAGGSGPGTSGGVPGEGPSSTSDNAQKGGGRPKGGGGHLFDKTRFIFLLSNENVAAVYDELGKISVKSLPRATALVLRMFLELSLVECLETSREMGLLKAEKLNKHMEKNERRKREGKTEIEYVEEPPNLAAMLAWITNSSSKLLSPLAKKAFSQQVNEEGVKMVLNLAPHNHLYYVDEGKVRAVWRDIGPSFFEQLVIKKRTDAHKS